jgi:hypothetical protein
MLYIGMEEQKLAVEMSKLLESRTKDTISSDWETYQIKKFARGEGTGLFESEEIEIEKYGDTWEGLCRQMYKKYILAAYVNRAWQYHMSQLELVDYEYTNKLAMQFMDVTGNSWIIWCCFSFDEDCIEGSNAESEIRYVAELAALPRYKLWKVHPVTWVSYLGLSKMLGLLLRRFPVLSNLEKTYFLGSPLHAASLRGNIRAVQLLTPANKGVNEKGGYDENPLVAAMFNRLVEVVELLLKSGANANSLIRFNGTALIAACHQGSLEIARLLIDSGANVNSVAKNSEYATAVLAACSSGSLEVVKLPVKLGADINVIIEYDNHGTALGVACYFGFLEVVRFLVDSGVSTGSKEEPGSAYCIAMEEYQQARDIESDKALEYKAILDLFDDCSEKQQSHSVKVGAIDPVPEALSDKVMEESEWEEDVTCLVLRTTT